MYQLKVSSTTTKQKTSRISGKNFLKSIGFPIGVLHKLTPTVEDGRLVVKIAEILEEARQLSQIKETVMDNSIYTLPKLEGIEGN